MLVVYETANLKPCLTLESAGQVELAISRDGTRLATRQGRTIRVLDVATGNAVREIEADSSGPLALTADGRQLACAVERAGLPGLDIALWDLDSGDRVGAIAFPGPVSGLSFSPDGSLLAAQARDGGTDVFRTQDGVQEFRFPSGLGRGVVFSPDGGALAVLSLETTRIEFLKGAAAEELPAAQVLAFHPDGRFLVLGREGTVEVVNERRECVRTIPVPGKGSSAFAAFLAGGTRVVVAGYWKRPVIVDVSTGDLVTELPFHMGLGMQVALSAEGRLLAVSGDESWFAAPSSLLASYFLTPFPSGDGFSPYRFPGLLVHLPVLGLFSHAGWLVCGAGRPLALVWILAGLYLGRDLAIAAHYNLLITVMVWALSVAGWVFGGMSWVSLRLAPPPSLWISGLLTAAIAGAVVLRARRSSD